MTKPKRKCPRCNGTGKITWPDLECDISRDILLNMLHEAVSEIYEGLVERKIIDGSIPCGHYSLLNLWQIIAEILPHQE